MAESMLALDATGRGDPIVLLHGVGASRGVWRRAIPLLAQRRRVITPDLPGFGESPAAGGGFRLAETADLLADELARRLGGRFDLVGNSLGGAVALVLARRRPELVRRLVLSAPAGLAPVPAPVPAAAGLLSGPAITARRRLGAPFAGNPTARRALFWGAIAAPQRLSREDALALLEASRGSTRIGAAIAAVLAADLRADLAALEVPVGFIWGERDRIVPISTLRTVRELRPDAVIETLPGAAHVPQVEAPGAFVAALRSVLARLRRREPRR